jgi:hypothetical protein
LNRNTLIGTLDCIDKYRTDQPHGLRALATTAVGTSKHKQPHYLGGPQLGADFSRSKPVVGSTLALRSLDPISPSR